MPRRTLAQADSANYMSLGVVNEYPPSFGVAKVKRRRRGDRLQCHKAVDVVGESGGFKNLPLPYDLLEIMGLPLPLLKEANPVALK